MKKKDIFWALIIVAIWGVNFTAVQIGLEEIPPILFSALRFTVVAIPAIFFISFPQTSFWNVLGAGIIWGVIKFSLLYIGMNVGVSAGPASLLLQSQVLFTIALSVIIFKEYLLASQTIGIVISIIGFSFFFLSTDGNVTISGLILILLAGLAWAVFNLIMKRLKNVSLLNFMVWVSAVPILPSFVISYFIETNEPVKLLINMTAQAWLCVAYVGFLGTLFAYAVWGKLLRSYTSAVVTPFALLIPVSGIITANIILNERLENIEIIGILFIMLGLILCVFGKQILLKIAYNKALQRMSNRHR